MEGLISELAENICHFLQLLAIAFYKDEMVVHAVAFRHLVKLAADQAKQDLFPFW